jgi:D-alanine-D-alanine ligase
MLNIAIVAGGDSGEYEISMRSGRQVEMNMDLERFRPYLIEIRGTEWNYWIEKKKFPIDKNDFSLTIGRKKIRFDAVFNAIHGSPGEDGKLQGYLDMLGMPYTSCGLTTSAVSFNKSVCKEVVAATGKVEVARSVRLRKDDKGMPGRLSHLKFPLFVKPNCGGSSVGMSKVASKKDLKASLDKAFREDEEVIVEEFVQGRELTCGVILTKGKVIALPVTEIISKKDFFDYEAKYQPGMADEVVPAQVLPSVSGKCQEISSYLFHALDCKGVVRFDYIFTGRKFFFLEVNTVPGISEASIVPKMAGAFGWTYSELVTRLLDEIL